MVQCCINKKSQLVKSLSKKVEESKFTITTTQLNAIIEQKSQAPRFIKDNYGNVNKFEVLLRTSFINGLTNDEDDIKARKSAFGINFIPPKPPRTFFSLILETLKDYIIQILIVCVFINFGVAIYSTVTHHNSHEGGSEWNEGIAILAAVLIVVLTTAGNDYNKEKQFRSLQNKIEMDQKVNIIRNNENVEILSSNLVVGDICVLKYGDVIPADGIIIQSSDLHVDESPLTGESDLVEKSYGITAIGGTHVVEGSGRMLVICVGPNTQAGIIFNMLGVTKVDPGDKNNEHAANKKVKEEEEEESQSVLQAKLNRIAIQIGYIGTVCAILTVATLITRMSLIEFVKKKKKFNVNVHISQIIDSFITGITVIVVAVPEGLPLAVTLSLAYSIKKMLKDNNMVRHLSACETMGNATIICSDKTGTLTTNRMTAVELFVCDTHYKVIPPAGKIRTDICQGLSNAISINSSYSSQILKSDDGQLPKQMGNKTECGLLGLVQALGQDYAAIRQKFPEQSFVKVFPFNSARKSMSTIIKKNENFIVYTKGAAENIVEMCTLAFNSEGEKAPLTLIRKGEIVNEVITKMANSGLRTIGVAYKALDKKNKPNAKFDEKYILCDLILVAIVGIMDPVREEVPSAIQSCQRAGISIRMVTGDNIYTARSIAKRCGILTEQADSTDLILESNEFNDLIRSAETKEVVQEKLDVVWPRLKVLARSSPQDKYILVSGIIKSHNQKERQVVAVTGDGTNDGPALKAADVGFAMGQAGTDVAKEASDIILLDDNFASIVKAVMWGRNVYDSISKFLQFQLTVNVVSLISTLVSVCITGTPPFRAVQMLWVNLIMDTLASLALATEQPTEELLNRKPYGRNQSLLSSIMLRNITMHSVYQLVVIHVLIFLGPELFDFENNFTEDTNKKPSVHSCMVFSTFVIMTLFNEINARKVDNQRNVFERIFTNLLFPIIWIISLILQIIISEFGGSFIFTHPLSIDLWGWCFFFGIGELVWQQVIFFISEGLLDRIRVHLKKIFRRNNLDSQDFSPLERNLSPSLSAGTWVRGVKRIETQIRVIKAFEQYTHRTLGTTVSSSELKQPRDHEHIAEYVSLLGVLRSSSGSKSRPSAISTKTV